MEEPKSEVIITPQYKVVCGIDIHKDMLVSHIGSSDGSISETKEWDTFTETLERLRNYLVEKRVEAVLLESTGVYWISLYHLLTETGLEVVVANPQHIKQIPKRKTDKKDAKWLCTLVMNGLVRKSFIPDSDQHDLRELCRMREKYNENETQASNRIVKILERANIKIRSVSSTIRTKTCQDIIKAIIAGERDPEVLASLAKGKLRNKTEELRKAVIGKITKSDKEQLEIHNEDIEHFQKQIKRLEQRIESILTDEFKQCIEILDTVSGIGIKMAQKVISEIGTGMGKFENADHLTSWAGLAPGNNESAGKRKNTSTKKGNKHIRTAMITIAWGAVRTKNSYWSYLFAFLKSKMPSKKAITAIARKMLKLIYKMLRDKSKYVEGGKLLFEIVQQKKRILSASKATQKAA